jgi:hypothetical protein
MESAFEQAKTLPFYLRVDVAVSGFPEAVSSWS